MDKKTIVINIADLYKAIDNGVNVYDLVAIALLENGIRIQEVGDDFITVADGYVWVTEYDDYIEIFWYKDKRVLH